MCRCWWEESCGWPAQGELCGAAHRPCARALLTHSGAGGDLGPRWPLENTRERFLSHLGWRSLSDRECLLRAASLLRCHLAATAGRGDLRLLTGWQITFEKSLSVLFSFCHRRVSCAKCCSQGCASQARLQACPAPGPCLGRASLAHVCSHPLLELCSDPRPCSSQLLQPQREFGLVPAQAPSALLCSQCLQLLARFLFVPPHSASCLFLPAASRLIAPHLC